MQKTTILPHNNPFQSSVAFHIETSHFICTVNLVIGFFMESNTAVS